MTKKTGIQILRAGIFIFSLLITMLAGLYILLNSKPVQTVVISKVCDYYSAELNTEVFIRGFEYNWLTFEFKRVWVNDQKGDSLLRIRNLKFVVDGFDFINRQLIIGRIALEAGRLNIKKYPGVKGLNVDFLRRYFTKGSKKKKSKKPFRVDVHDVALSHCGFSYSDLRKRRNTRELDPSYIHFYDINGRLEQVNLIGDSLHTYIRQANMKEACGLQVLDFNASLSAGSQILDLKQTLIQTPHSRIKGDLAFLYTDWENFEDFEDSVRMRTDIRYARLGLTDIGYLNKSIRGYHQVLQIKGKANGTVRNLQIAEGRVSFGNQTFFEGSARFKGLPEWEETYMDVDVVKSSTTLDEMTRFLQMESLPKEFARLGNVSFIGQVKGFPVDFTTDGKFTTALGDGSLDLDVKWADSSDIPEYSGDISLNQFDIGQFYQVPDYLTKTTLQAHISGKSFRFTDMTLDINSDVQRLDVLKYPYSGIKIDGHLAQRKFSGSVEVKDPNAIASFNGEVNFTRKQPSVQADFVVKEARLKKLNIDSVESSFSTHTVLSYSGFQGANQDGKLYIDHILWKRKGVDWLSKSILAEWTTQEGTSTLDLGSAWADIQLKGNFRFDELIPSFKNLVSMYFPSVVPSNIRNFDHVMDYKIELKNTREFFHQFYPDMELGILSLKGHTEPGAGMLNGKLRAEMVRWRFLKIQGWEGSIDMLKGGGGLKMNNQIGLFSLADSIRFSRIQNETTLRPDSVWFDWKSAASDQWVGAKLYAGIFFQPGHTTLRMDESKLVIHGKPFTIEEDSRMYIFKKSIQVPEFNLFHENEYISFFGTMGEQVSDQMSVRYDRFDLSFLNYFFKTVKGGIYGSSTGRLDILSISSNPVVIGDVLINKFIAGPDTLGDLILGGTFDAEKNVLSVRGKSTGGLYQGMTLSGNIYTKQNNRLELDLSVPTTEIAQFGHYLQGIFSQIKGRASAELKIRGVASDPQISGFAIMEEGHFRIDYLNTYHRFFTTRIEILPGEIKIPKTKVLDENADNFGFLEGSIFHTQYEKFRFDLYIKEAKGIKVLQTTEKDNDLFYGVAYASGYAHIHGPEDDIQFDIQARSEKGTKIFIPVSESSSAGMSEFIRFVNYDTTSKTKKTEKKIDLSGIRMNFNFTMTPEAEFQLIFDQALGDIIKGNGSGDIRMEVDTRGTFKMFGLYTIEKGNYLFTALNVFSKQFVIKPGGTITWEGDPYQAKLNMVAYNQVKASPDPLLTSVGVNPGTAQTQPAITVNCNLYLQGVMLQPDIKFGLEFPDIAVQNSDNNTVLTTILKQIENDPEELNRQVFSLIMMKRFLPRSGTSAGNPFGGNAAGTSLGASASDLVSSQLSNWLSQFAPGWEVTFNYQTANSTQNRELIVGLLKRFYNDRLLVEASYSIENQLLNNFYSQYILSKDGRFRVTAFRRTTNNPVLNQNVNTNGVGLFYRKEFEYILPEKRKKLK